MPCENTKDSNRVQNSASLSFSPLKSVLQSTELLEYFLKIGKQFKKKKVQKKRIQNKKYVALMKKVNIPTNLRSHGPMQTIPVPVFMDSPNCPSSGYTSIYYGATFKIPMYKAYKLLCSTEGHWPLPERQIIKNSLPT